MPNELETINDRICDINHLMSIGEMMQIGNDVDFMLEQIKEFKKNYNLCMIEWIQANGEFEANGNVYKVGKTKTVKCTNLASTVEAVLGACGGDFDQFVEVLSSGAFKPAATMQVLGDDAELHFQTIWKDKIELKKIPTNLISTNPKEPTK